MSFSSLASVPWPKDKSPADVRAEIYSGVAIALVICAVFLASLIDFLSKGLKILTVTPWIFQSAFSQLTLKFLKFEFNAQGSRMRAVAGSTLTAFDLCALRRLLSHGSAIRFKALIPSRANYGTLAENDCAAKLCRDLECAGLLNFTCTQCIIQQLATVLRLGRIITLMQCRLR